MIASFRGRRYFLVLITSIDPSLIFTINNPLQYLEASLIRLLIFSNGSMGSDS